MTDLGVAVPVHHVGVVENDVAAHRLGESPDRSGAAERSHAASRSWSRNSAAVCDKPCTGQAKMTASRTCFPTRIQGRLRPRAMLTKLYPRTPWRNREPDGAFRHRG